MKKRAALKKYRSMELVVQKDISRKTLFDSGLWCGLVDCVTVYSRDNIKVKFKDGTEI